MFPLRAASWIGSALGLLALALSVSGLYGVLAYMLSQRTREIGIRVALGATGGAVIRLVLSQSARLAAIGALVGAAIAFGVLRLLGAAVPLRNITWIDAPAFGASLVLVAFAMALATVVPAWRATRVNPSDTLRADG
jgi:ABC-type antimicrobial peptide transport system permease subunit